MDNRMPIMNGVEATRRIRTLAKGKDVLNIYCRHCNTPLPRAEYDDY
ncbi:MAG: hypothetical protein LUO95_09980 [Methylococcaceae bacterium]|nr:hypothetical protein [Methylococcaceae bacterium]MDD1617128.1 hypothetical protein [Methylococcaceae bacterium]